MRRQACWFLGCWLPLLAGCRPTPPPAANDPAKLPEKRAHVSLGANAVDVNLRNQAGEAVLHASGRLRAAVRGKSGTAELLDVHATSAVPGWAAATRAGRLLYRLGDSTVTFDRRWWVSVPTRQADLEAETATLDLERKTYTIPGFSRAHYGPVELSGKSASAALDLRSLTVTQPTARQTGESRSWRLTGTTAHVDDQRQVTLTTVSGEVHEGETVAKLAAPTAVWDDQAQTLTLSDGASLTREGLRLTATALVWRRTDGLVQATGTTRVERGALVVTGESGRFDLVRRAGTVQAVVITTQGSVLHAASGRLDAARNVTLTDLHGQLKGGTAVAAPTAVWQSAAGQLVLPRGGRATWSQTANSFTASGGVTLTQPGQTVSGGTLTGPADLSTATLTPVRASGDGWSLRAADGHWSKAGPLQLRRPSGTFHDGQRTVQASSGRATVGRDHLVRFTDSFRAADAHGAVLLTAPRAEYEPATRRFRAMGGVAGTFQGTARRNGAWHYRVGQPAGGKKESATHDEQASGKEPDRAVGSGDRPRPGSSEGPEVRRSDTGDHGTP